MMSCSRATDVMAGSVLNFKRQGAGGFEKNDAGIGFDQILDLITN